MMRKILLIILILSCAYGYGQKLQYVNTYGYEYERFAARTLLGLPKDTFTVPADLQDIPFIANKAGAIYKWNIVTHIWDAFSGGGGALSGEGTTVSNDSVHIGGLVTSPAALTTDRNILANRRVLVFGNTIPGMAHWIFSDSAYSPFQFLSNDTITSNDMALSRTRPLSTMYLQRNIVFTPGIYQQTKMYGALRAATQMIWTDSVKVRTDGGDYHTNIIEYRFEPTGSGRQRAKIGHGTGSENRDEEAVSPLVTNMVVGGQDVATTDTTYINGTIAGITPYLVTAMSNRKVIIKKYVSVLPNNSIGANTKILKYVDYGSSSFKLGTNSSLVDSAYILDDTSSFKRMHWRGNTVIGEGLWSSTDKLKVGGNVNITDSVIVGKATNIADTTGYDFVLRKRSDGALMRITASQMSGFFGGSTPTFQQVLTAGSTLTSSNTVNIGSNDFLSDGTGEIGFKNGSNYYWRVRPNYSELTIGNGTTDFIGYAISPALTQIYSSRGSSYGAYTIDNDGSRTVYVVDADSINLNFDRANQVAIPDSANYKVLLINSGGRLFTTDFSAVGTGGGGGGGSGTVNSGTANRLTYYPSTGATVDDLAAITANRAIVSDANGLPTHSATTNTEIGYVAGVTSSVQTQINNKQDYIGEKRVFWVAPASATTVATVGTNAYTSSGTISTPTPTTTNLLTSTRRTSLSTGASPGATARVNNTSLEVWRGNAAGLGGFKEVFRWGLNTTQTGNRVFVGLASTASALTNVDHFTNTAIDRVGCYIDAATGNWFLIHNTSGSAATAIDLGANFAVNTTDLLELKLEAAPNASTISYIVNNLSTGNTTSGTLSTNLPTATNWLAQHTWCNNNAQSAAVIVDMVKMYSETNY